MEWKKVKFTGEREKEVLVITRGGEVGKLASKYFGPSSLSLEKEIEKNIGLAKESAWVFC